MTARRNTQKFGMLQLLKLCRKFGIEPEGIKIISNELGVSTTVVYKKIYEYCIIPNLHNKDLEV